ncbi:MAG: 4-oxalocrotonate tautomerase [Pseudomonadota bacterium]|mgnify:FL=1|jgi:4-oxalocrotonate tautomerase|uniref:Tautomerase n=1 Tax=Alteromonas oceani TaxID=2071609 RepID=A0ABV7K6E3_9ALTE|nr:4-oxalocrotonate tautomerase [Alteromonas oceani]MAD10587.1 2-hydroxymuconate tautomerase [Alteromonas sp.]MAJ70262.1 2-hydroxymuconate tautomerase [Alteromonadaceae bacterium]MDY6926750.1 4-oxalocrotonate tautomerase [Pseudomonadota bacterium]RPH23115.1 MAG: 4-oxalocrotonate tautomerase [Alteromonadaceae bacterium TMED7]MCP4863706.1 4-oxalocrotonate tautomerase [Alteromonas sp.]|tara:strand:+ start:1057 stop:1245 length:189 start_codon:yes stop_codon:yes gene_type:complete
MPIAHLEILEGRTAEQRAKLISEVTDAISRSIDAPKERVRVIITEVPKANWGIGGVPASEVR